MHGSTPGVRIILTPLFLLGLGGCAGVHLHDPGRKEVAEEAVVVAKELREGGFAVFDAMESNLEVAIEVREQVDQLLDAAWETTFDTYFAELSGEDIAFQLQSAIDTHAEARTGIESGIEAATESVKKSLEDQKLFVALVDEGETGDTPEELLETIGKRLRWIGDRAKDLRGESPEGSTGRSPAVPLVDTVAAVLEAPAEDPLVREATRLLVEAAQSAAASETLRLGEYRRHLRALQTQKASFDRRHEMWQEIFPVLGALLPPDLLFQLSAAGDLGLPPCQHPPPGEAEDCRDLIQQLGALHQRDWGGSGTLLEFASRNLAADRPREDREGAAASVAALGVLLFVEAPKDLRASVAVATEQHRHSIRLSKLNGQQRLDLIHQLAQGLEIYHKGGIKPEEIAQLVLLAGQVGAIASIGAN